MGWAIGDRFLEGAGPHAYQLWHPVSLLFSRHRSVKLVYVIHFRPKSAFSGLMLPWTPQQWKLRTNIPYYTHPSFYSSIFSFPLFFLNLHLLSSFFFPSFSFSSLSPTPSSAFYNFLPLLPPFSPYVLLSTSPFPHIFFLFCSYSFIFLNIL
jgi:hypothetical protein